MPKSGFAAVASVVIGCLALGCSAAAASPANDPQARTQARHPPAAAFAQEPVRPRRPRITVRPRTTSPAGIYPSPLPYNYPGPNAVRDCDSRLVVEHRPSGTVIVPRMWCWWTRQP